MEGVEDERKLLNEILSPDATLYDILGISRDATIDVITKRYRLLARKFHPDTYHGEYQDDALEAFKKISHAAEVLRDDSRRIEYDYTLPRQQSYRPQFTSEANTSNSSTRTTQNSRENESSEREKEAELYHANIYFLKDMLSIVRDDPTTDISEYSQAIIATLFLASGDILAFLYSNPVFLIPLGFLALYLTFQSSTERQQMIDTLSWNNLPSNIKITLIEFLIAYNEHRLSRVIGSR